MDRPPSSRLHAAAARGLLVRHASRLRLTLLASIANQALTSGANFMLGIYLARTMPLADFGLYSMAYGACMLYLGIGNALLLTRMSVVLSPLPEHERRSQAAGLLTAVLMMGAVLLALPVLGAALHALLPWPASADTARALDLALPTALAAASMLASEFFSSYAYLRQRVGVALAINAISLATVATGLAALHASEPPASPAQVMALTALGAALAAVAGWLATRFTLNGAGTTLRAAWPAAWRDGRWALGGAMGTWMQSQSYAYALAWQLGPAGAGLANLARLFISPFSFLLPAINKIAVPRLAALRHDDPRRMRQLSLWLTAALGLLALLYTLLLYPAFGIAEQLLAGREVPGLAPLVALWCLVLLCQVLRSGGAVLMQLQLRFRVLALATLPSAAVTVAATVVLAHWGGAPGALCGLLAGEITLLLLIWKEIRDDRTPAHG